MGLREKIAGEKISLPFEGKGAVTIDYVIVVIFISQPGCLICPIFTLHSLHSITRLLRIKMKLLEILKPLRGKKFQNDFLSTILYRLRRIVTEVRPRKAICW